MDDEVEVVSRIVAIEGGLHGHEVFAAGGRLGSRPSPTTTSKSSKCATSET
jgi:hypothetical protein